MVLSSVCVIAVVTMVTAVQMPTAVTAHLKSEQLQLFVFAMQLQY